MEWSEGRIKGFITSVLRSGFRKWPPKYVVLTNSKAGKKVNKTTGRQAEHYRCSKCKKEFPLKEVQVDHITPVVSVEEGFVDWNTFIERLYCGKENLQVLCKKCHGVKTRKEIKKRNG